MVPKFGFLSILLKFQLEMLYLNAIEQLFLFVEQLDQLEVCLPYSTRLLTGNTNTGGIPKFKVEFKLNISTFIKWN